MGIILVSTRDSFSKLITLITDDPYNSIGIYYPVSVMGSNFTCVHLYNIWENSTPVWVNYFIEEKSHTGHLKLEEIIRYHLVDKVITYPIKSEYRNRFKIFFSKIIANDDYGKIDNPFVWLLSFITNCTYQGKDHTTGYDIINYIIKMLDNPKCSKPLGTMELFRPNPLLSPKRTNNIVGPKSLEKINQKPYFSDQLNNLVNTFKEMYNSSDIFRTKLIEQKNGETLIDYINIEDNLHECMKKGLSCQDLIEPLNKIRDKVSAKSLKESDCYDDKRDEIAKELLSVRCHLTKILTDIKEDQDPVIIYFDKFLSHYNNMCEILGITPLDIPEISSATSIITTDQSVVTKLDNNFITVRVSDLTRYNKEELREILKTTNEISIVDSKYISLQNSIARELSGRNKND